MSVETKDEVELPDFLNMSDEEIKAYDPSSFTPASEEVVEAAAESVNADIAAVEETAEEEDGVDDKDDLVVDKTNTGDAVVEEAGDAGIAGDSKADQAVAAPAKETKAAAVSDPAKTQATAEVAAPVDYKAAYERLTAPFKANGRDIQVANVDDAIALMQMGANYNKKMAAFKPNLKLLKMLETNGLLSEEKIGYMIDLEKKNPEAINKLVKDSGIDPLDMSAEKAGEYKPGNHTVDERELELDAVLDELASSPTYDRTLKVVSTQWDKASKSTIADAPSILKVIDAHMGNGIYDLITKEMENERTFGRLQGLTDLEAYRQVGDSIHARGGFAHLGHQKQATNTPAEPVIVQPKPKPAVDDAKLREQRRAASSTKTTVATASVKADFNPLNLPDEEFGKVIPKFL